MFSWIVWVMIGAFALFASIFKTICSWLTSNEVQSTEVTSESQNIEVPWRKSSKTLQSEQNVAVEFSSYSENTQPVRVTDTYATTSAETKPPEMTAYYGSDFKFDRIPFEEQWKTFENLEEKLTNTTSGSSAQCWSEGAASLRDATFKSHLEPAFSHHREYDIQPGSMVPNFTEFGFSCQPKYPVDDASFLRHRFVNGQRQDPMTRSMYVTTEPRNFGNANVKYESESRNKMQNFTEFDFSCPPKYSLDETNRFHHRHTNGNHQEEDMSRSMDTTAAEADSFDKTNAWNSILGQLRHEGHVDHTHIGHSDLSNEEVVAPGHDTYLMGDSVFYPVKEAEEIRPSINRRSMTPYHSNR